MKPRANRELGMNWMPSLIGRSFQVYCARNVQSALGQVCFEKHHCKGSQCVQACIAGVLGKIFLGGFCSDEHSCEDANVLCANLWVGFVAPIAFVSWEVSQRCNPL